MVENIPSEVKSFNKNRNPYFLKMKYEAMRENRYRFFKATAHIFYKDLFKNSPLLKSPNTWLCGDLHFENFGSYKSNDRIAYFNINDFDESCLGPCLIDISRMISSIYIASPSWGINQKEATSLSGLFLDHYFKNLENAQCSVLEKETASGLVKKFLSDVQNRKRKLFLKKRTTRKKGERKILIDNKKTFVISNEEKNEIANAIGSMAKKTTNPEFYEIKDIAFRVAGASSLGLNRYVALVEGKGSPNENYLLDIKETKNSCLENFLKVKQPKWNSQSERVIEIEKLIQSKSPALLHSLNFGNKDYVLRELQPSADKIDHCFLDGNKNSLEEVLRNMANLYAWGNIGCSGRKGAAVSSEFARFAKKSESIRKELLNISVTYAKANDRYFNVYSKAFDKGFFNLA
jgi:uncharacterized protein (DUF2252 family)